MGRTSRHTPKRLAEKLCLVRKILGIRTLEEMATRLDIGEINLYRSTISEYEKGKREPPLIVLLRYSELSSISMNDLVDDRVDLKFGRRK
jgi:transcriptional regulator with XRE-family HTH domain